MKTQSKLLVGLIAIVSSTAAMADTASDAVITGAMTSAGTSVATYGAALVGLALVGVGFGVGIKYLKKIPRVA
jgi:ABC-type Mn2+/Zn2+ transport system permease subunit